MNTLYAEVEQLVCEKSGFTLDDYLVTADELADTGMDADTLAAAIVGRVDQETFAQMMWPGEKPQWHVVADFYDEYVCSYLPVDEYIRQVRGEWKCSTRDELLRLLAGWKDGAVYPTVRDSSVVSAQSLSRSQHIVWVSASRIHESYDAYQLCDSTIAFEWIDRRLLEIEIGSDKFVVEMALLLYGRHPQYPNAGPCIVTDAGSLIAEDRRIHDAMMVLKKKRLADFMLWGGRFVWIPCQLSHLSEEAKLAAYDICSKKG